MFTARKINAWPQCR